MAPIKTVVQFKHHDRKYRYAFDNKINVLFGDSAIGKSFIEKGVPGDVSIDGVQTYLKYITESDMLTGVPPTADMHLVCIDETFTLQLSYTHKLKELLQQNNVYILIIRDQRTVQLGNNQGWRFYTLHTAGNSTETELINGTGCTDHTRIFHIDCPDTSKNEVNNLGGATSAQQTHNF